MKFRAPSPVVTGDDEEAAPAAVEHSTLALPGEGDDAAQRPMQLEVASYIEILSAELGEMAKSADLKTLAYFLEMARLEASIQVERRAASTFER